MVGLSAAAKKAHDDVVQIFHLRDKRNGKDIMRCSRCEDMRDEKGRGKHFQVNLNGVTKAKEHIAVYCPGLRPEVNSTVQVTVSLVGLSEAIRFVRLFEYSPSYKYRTRTSTSQRV